MEVKATSRPETIAITIASLAIDGGTFIIGIEEITEKGLKRLSPKPLDLTGLPEKVDVVARNNIDPPMAVRSRGIPSDAQPGKGYLVVEVDPSPVAPHMACWSYYGRAETTRYKLTDNDVLRLHQLRRNQENLASDLLDHKEDRDYLTPNQSALGHLYIVAEPLSRMPAPALAVLQDSSALWAIISDRERGIASSSGPHPWEADSIKERNAGIAFVTSHASGPGRTPNAYLHEQRTWEPKMLDIEVQTTGGFRIYQSAATFPHPQEDFRLFWTRRLSRTCSTFWLGLVPWSGTPITPATGLWVFEPPVCAASRPWPRPAHQILPRWAPWTRGRTQGQRWRLRGTFRSGRRTSWQHSWATC
jgi:hypothetical protein